MLAKPTEAVTTSWSSSSCSVGKGWRSCFEASMQEPQRVRRQSVKVPLWSLICVSLTTTDHLPRPVSPLGRIGVSGWRGGYERQGSLPVRYGHKGPVFVACIRVILPAFDG